MTMDASGVQLSDAVASPVKSGETDDSQLIVAGGGHNKVGFSKSVMCIVCVQLVLLPQASVTVQVLSSVPVLLHPRGTISISVYVTTNAAAAVQLSLR